MERGEKQELASSILVRVPAEQSPPVNPEGLNVLVAGGTNFIGRTIATVLGRDHTVTVLNRGRVPAAIRHGLPRGRGPH